MHVFWKWAFRKEDYASLCTVGYFQQKMEGCFLVCLLSFQETCLLQCAQTVWTTTAMAGARVGVYMVYTEEYVGLLGPSGIPRV